MDFARLSRTEMLILQALISKGERYGLDLVLGSDGKLKRGTVYVLLDRLEEKGFVESRKEPAPPGAQGPARRLYKVTGHGERVLEVWEALYTNPALLPVPATR